MKVDKYDRQIRLWGVKGQRKLGQAKVALVGCSGAAIQALKNLVLPGIGHIQIFDDTQITVEDLSSTFFYEYESVGSLKCQEALKNLLQMNPDVSGKSYKQSFNDFLKKQASVLQQYNLIIFGNNLTQKQICQASLRMEQVNVCCIFLSVLGHYFYVRLQKSMHFVESSNSQASKKYYLSIDDAFEQLRKYSENWNIYKTIEQLQKIGQSEQQSQKKRQLFREISNIPYPILLMQVYEHLPQQNRKRNQIGEQLKKIKQKIHEKYRDNFNEAINRILDLYQTPDNFLINNYQLINQDGEESPLNQIKSKFCSNKQQLPNIIKFLILVREFYKQNKKLPQPTNLPDMHTTTKNYIQLKNIYKQKHNQDIKILINKYSQHFTQLTQQQRKNYQETFSEYINNIQNLEIIDMKPFHKQIQSPQTMLFCYNSPNQQSLYVTMKSYNIWHQKYPQKLIEPSDLDQLKSICLEKVLKQDFKDTLLKGFSDDDYKTNMQILQKYLKDICRGRGSNKNINICSMAGAIAAQQAIKLISGCFRPMNSGYLFDGANGSGYQLQL